MKENQKILTQKFIDLLQQKQWSCGFAESCSGGMLSSWITHYPGVSKFFFGSVVSYSNEVKKEVLQVKASTLENHGAVSSATVKEMLVGVRHLLKVDVAAAISGIAGPSGGTPDKPVGLVFVAVSGPSFEEVQKLQLTGDREMIQQQSCEYALQMMIQGLQKS